MNKFLYIVLYLICSQASGQDLGVDNSSLWSFVKNGTILSRNFYYGNMDHISIQYFYKDNNNIILCLSSNNRALNLFLEDQKIPADERPDFIAQKLPWILTALFRNGECLPLTKYHYELQLKENYYKIRDTLPSFPENITNGDEITSYIQKNYQAPKANFDKNSWISSFLSIGTGSNVEKWIVKGSLEPFLINSIETSHIYYIKVK